MGRKNYEEMKGTNYSLIINQLSSTYEKGTRAGLDELLDSYKEDLGEFSHSIINRVVVEEYLDKKGADRIFGSFPDHVISKLIKRCQELDASSNKSHL